MAIRINHLDPIPRRDRGANNITPHKRAANCSLGNKLFHLFFAAASALEKEEVLCNWMLTKLYKGAEQEADYNYEDQWGYKWTELKRQPDHFPLTFVGFYCNTEKKFQEDIYCQTPTAIELISKYKKELVQDFGDNDGVFVHLRLGDLVDMDRLELVPTYEYYKHCLSQLNFSSGFIGSDSPDHPLTKRLLYEFDLEFYDDTPENTISFGSAFKNKVLSLGTFSWWIGFIGNQNNVIHPCVSDFPFWHGTIFESMTNWNSVSKKVYL